MQTRTIGKYLKAVYTVIVEHDNGTITPYVKGDHIIIHIEKTAVSTLFAGDKNDPKS